MNEERGGHLLPSHLLFVFFFLRGVAVSGSVLVSILTARLQFNSSAATNIVVRLGTSVNQQSQFVNVFIWPHRAFYILGFEPCARKGKRSQHQLESETWSARVASAQVIETIYNLQRVRLLSHGKM
jgi:hypothetical protein